MIKLKRIFLAFAVFSLLQLGLLPVMSVAFEPLDGACTGATAQSDVCQGRGQENNPVSGNDGIILKATDILSWVVGAAAVIMVIIGGFKIVSSTGDANSVKSGRNTIIYALVGVVVVLISRSLIIFVVNRV